MIAFQKTVLRGGRQVNALLMCNINNQFALILYCGMHSLLRN
ncbi:hypothetical protein CEV33_4397 [Brucella grignonensis]|uniref:Uncharacterized protein n=1 Tax=Brucella grignonensis TaxID=94627 RepID=A0A256FNH3_9HYPH|nr:hypothetical protein CEV33_4397 [Brucella grignonensis]